MGEEKKEHKELVGMTGFDLRKFQEDGEEHELVKQALGKFLSGRPGYETIIEKKQEKIKRCSKCNWALTGGEKFCPDCGNKS